MLAKERPCVGIDAAVFAPDTIAPPAAVLLGLVWDAVAFLVLPALLLDPVASGRVDRAIRVSLKGFVESLIVVAALRALATLVGMLTVGAWWGTPMAIGATVLSIVAGLLFFAWMVTARVAAYRAVAAREPQPTIGLTGPAGALG